MGTLWPKSGLIARDNSDVLADGAKAYFTNGGTSTPKTVYQDAAETTPHTNPVVTDGDGRWPAVFVPWGSYKERITTAAGAAIGPTIDNIPNTEPIDATFSVDANSLVSTGKIIFALGNETLAGFVRLNGRSIGNAASSATERANADTESLFTLIYNRLADAQAAVSGGRGASAAADFAANKNIALPDCRGTGLRGFDQMGGTDAGRMASAPVVSGSTILPGSLVGSNTQVLTTANLASHTHTGTTATEAAHTHTGTTSTEAPDHTHTTAGTTGTVSASHNHTFTWLQAGFNITAGAQNVITAIAATGQPNTLTTTNQSADHTHAFSGTSGGVSANHAHTFTSNAGSAHSHTFTSAASGSDTAHNNVARDLLVTFYIRL